MTTKDNILATALRLFAAQGIDKTSTAQISREVGISSGALFVHFKTKQDLIDELYVQTKRAAFAGLIDLVDDGKPVGENMQMLAKRVAEYFLRHPQELIFFELIEVDPQISPAAREAARASYGPLFDQMMAWEKTGEIKELPLELLQFTFWHSVVALIKYCQLKKRKTVPAEMLAIVWDAVRA